MNKLILKKIPDRNYWMSETPITEAQWAEVMDGKVKISQKPKVNITFYEAENFCDNLSAKFPKYKFRLPTSEEWEYCARGGEDFVFAGSNTIDEVGWYSGNADELMLVKLLKPNGYGLYDMSGNVWEWTSTEAGSLRVGRGGSWDYFAYYCRVAYRNYFSPACSYNSLGFRVVAELKDKE